MSSKHQTTVVTRENSFWSRVLRFSFVVFILLLADRLFSKEFYANTKERPHWVSAVGRLSIPSSQLSNGERLFYEETCTGTLIADETSAVTGVLLTAWHCLENYKDLSRQIRFHIKTKSGLTISRIAYQRKSGGGMHADWALLSLHKTIARKEVNPIEATFIKLTAGNPLFFAGYIKKEEVENTLYELKFEKCNIVKVAESEILTDCSASKGNSGGPAVIPTNNGSFKLIGVISQGDGSTLSTVVPVTTFQTKLMNINGKSK